MSETTKRDAGTSGEQRTHQECERLLKVAQDEIDHLEGCIRAKDSQINDLLGDVVSECSGAGTPQADGPTEKLWSDCPRCDDGIYNGRECSICWGTGRITESLVQVADVLITLLSDARLRLDHKKSLFGDTWKCVDCLRCRIERELETRFLRSATLVYSSEKQRGHISAAKAPTEQDWKEKIAKIRQTVEIARKAYPHSDKWLNMYADDVEDMLKLIDSMMWPGSAAISGPRRSL